MASYQVVARDCVGAQLALPVGRGGEGVLFAARRPRRDEASPTAAQRRRVTQVQRHAQALQGHGDVAGLREEAWLDQGGRQRVARPQPEAASGLRVQHCGRRNQKI